MRRTLLAILGLALAAGCAATTTSTRASLKATTAPGSTRPAIEASFVVEWGHVAAKGD